MSNKWHEKREKAAYFWLKITFYAVNFLPKILLKPIIFFVISIYYIFCVNERRNIKNFYTHLNEKFGVKKKNAFWNFYEFALSITDKIAVWLGKIKFNDLILEDKNELEKIFFQNERGKIIIVSHFGNIEICRALSERFETLKMAILIYDKNSLNFAKFINEISKSKIKIFKVDDLDISKMLEFSNFIENGGFICVMGDRNPLQGNKFCVLNFLGKKANFPSGAFNLARILKAEILALWCVKKGQNYHLKADFLSKQIPRGKECEIAQKYAQILEQNCKEFPQMWFNFFDFWDENEKL